VALADRLVQRNHVVLGDESGLVTDEGRAFLSELGIGLDNASNSRRAFCRPCLDWSERRWHIGGFIGAALADRCFELGWTERQKDGRAVTITPSGQRALKRIFGVSV